MQPEPLSGHSRTAGKRGRPEDRIAYLPHFVSHYNWGRNGGEREANTEGSEQRDRPPRRLQNRNTEFDCVSPSRDCTNPNVDRDSRSSSEKRVCHPGKRTE